MRLLLKQLENLNFQICTSEGLEGLDHGILRERQILMGHDCLSVDTNDDYVTVTASFVKDGKFMERSIRCNILVGADGAGSTVRKLVGIDMKGERELQNLISVHFLSKDLGQYLLNERPGMLFFIFNTEAIGVLVAHDLKEGEFVFQVSHFLNVYIFEEHWYHKCAKILIDSSSCRYHSIHLSKTFKISVLRYSLS